jgi:hypothetical protein
MNYAQITKSQVREQVGGTGCTLTSANCMRPMYCKACCCFDAWAKISSRRRFISPERSTDGSNGTAKTDLLCVFSKSQQAQVKAVLEQTSGLPGRLRTPRPLPFAKRTIRSTLLGARSDA